VFTEQTGLVVNNVKVGDYSEAQKEGYIAKFEAANRELQNL
jgi:hypothetical protein